MNGGFSQSGRCMKEIIQYNAWAEKVHWIREGLQEGGKEAGRCFWWELKIKIFSYTQSSTNA